MSKKGIVILISSIVGGLVLLGITIFAAFSMMKPASWTFRDYKNLERNYTIRESYLINKYGKPEKTESIKTSTGKFTYDIWGNTTLGKGEKIMVIFENGRKYIAKAGNSEEMEEEIVYDKEYRQNDALGKYDDDYDDDYEDDDYEDDDDTDLSSKDYLDILKQLEGLDED